MLRSTKNFYNCLYTVSIKSQISKISNRNLSTNNENFKGNYDVIIAGGGMVGCTLACTMGKRALLSNLKVLLLEGSPSQVFELKPEYSNRVVALNQNTKALMNTLNVWKHVENIRVQPVRHMQVWDACSDALITFSSSDILDDDVAYIVENDVLLHSIDTELKNADVKNVDIVYGAKISSYELPKTSDSIPANVVKMTNGDTYKCRLLIGADGANSAVRQAMGVQYVSWNYDQMGVVATLELAEEAQNNTAWQRFLPTGPIALLPLNSTKSSLVWSTTKAHAKDLLKMPKEQFVDAINDAMEGKRASVSPDGKQSTQPMDNRDTAGVAEALPAFKWKQYERNSAIEACTTWVGSCLRRVGLPDGAERQLPPSVRTAIGRAAFPLGFGHSTRYVAPGVALVGDAAHRVHPLAGQGVNLGFGDVKELTDNLADAMYCGLDITHNSWLEKYECSRQRHNVPTQFAIDALHRLYSFDITPLVLARSVGLQLVNALHPIKKLIMSHATA